MTDRAVFRPSTGVWYANIPGGGATSQPWGYRSDVLVPGNYINGFAQERAIWRPDTGVWWILDPFAGQFVTIQYDQLGDIPI